MPVFDSLPIPCHHFVSPLRTDKRTCRRVFFLVPYLPWKVIFYIRVLNAPGPVLLGADAHEGLRLVVGHVGCSVFLSHLKLEDTVERFPIRHLALSLCTEDVRAHYDALTLETRERLKKCLVSEGSGSRHEGLSGACSRLSQNLSKFSLVWVLSCSCEKKRQLMNPGSI